MTVTSIPQHLIQVLKALELSGMQDRFPCDSSTWSAVLYADVTQFDGTDPEVHPAAWKLAEHIRGVIRAATAIPTGYTLESALPCRRPPGHRKCPGWIRISRQDIPPHVN
jgi:hypothetical protein